MGGPLSKLEEPMKKLQIWEGLGATKPVGMALEPAWRALEPAGRALEPAWRALEPAGRALEPDGRALEPARRALEPGVRVSGRPQGDRTDGRTEGRKISPFYRTCVRPVNERMHIRLGD